MKKHDNHFIVIGSVKITTNDKIYIQRKQN